MRVGVTGATGNVGSALVPLLAADPAVEEVVGIARREPPNRSGEVRWERADVTRDDLVPRLAGIDVLVHLAWAIQPSHRPRELRAVNVVGSRRVLAAAARAGVGAVVHASSVGAYSPSVTPPGARAREDHPVDGVMTSFYSRHKAEVERMLDSFEAEHPSVRVARLRPALTFQRHAATGIRRLFLGPLFPGSLLRLPIPVVPYPAGLVLQAVHASDVAEAYRLAVLSEARGAFNLAAEPVLDAGAVASLLRGRAVEVPLPVVRSTVEATWRGHLQPTPAGWLDLARLVPLLDSGRARRELGWTPRVSAVEALADLLDGLRQGADHPTPPLSKRTSAPLRWRELVTGVGERSGVPRRRAAA